MVPPAQITIGVMGSGSDEFDDLAKPLGQLLARLGVNLLTGAGAGVMTSVSRAFIESPRLRGISIGIVPCASIENRVQAKDSYPNPFVELPILTHLPYSGEQGQHDLSRNHINILSSAAIVALPGGPGTISEVELAVKYRKPIVAFSSSKEHVSRFHRSVRRAQSIADVEAFLRSVLPDASDNR
jgi:uncharacterized protein (TIGR00725 family)